MPPSLRRALAFLTCVFCTLALLVRAALPAAAKTERPPNIVLIYADDLGYADLGCYGARGYQTPNLDRMAREGTRFTDFYVAQAVCSASRAALLTGCYSNRVGILGALGPNARTGINASELTLAELCRQAPGGPYATAAFGKWHLGNAATQPEFHPSRHGFDTFLGLPYSNDMWPNHPTARGYPPLPLVDGDHVAETNPDQSRLTTLYTERATQFIRGNRERPFFLYLAHSMPHVPLFVSDKFKGKTERGLYGDVIAEIDWSVGEVLKTLKKEGLDEKTLVIFASDNGPWLSYGEHSGSSGPLREGKGTSFEGGVRVPALFRWPGKIRPGTVSHEPAMTIDILPTVARLLNVPLPKERIIDGKDIWPLLAREKGAKSPHEALYIYWGGALEAVRSGKWKLHLPHEYRTLNGKPGGRDGQPAPYTNAKIDTALFDLEADPGETRDVAAEHPDVLRRLLELAEQAREDLGDTATGRRGKNLRPAGQVP